MAGINSFDGITADNSGSFYVVKNGGYNSIIQKFSSAGVYITEIQIPDGHECLWLTSDGTYIYACHSVGINKYDTSLSLVSSFTKPFGWSPNGIIIIDSYLYVNYTDMTYQYQISKFDLSLNLISTAVISGGSGSGIGTSGNLIYIISSGAVCSIPISFTDGETLTPTPIFSVNCNYFTVDLSGNFIVSSDAIYIYSSAGSLIQTLPAGSADGEFSSPVGIFVK